MNEYFSSWSSDNYKRLSEMLKAQIYSKYLIKCEVFQRDEFKCTNIDCKYPNSKLTLHHVRFQKNGGKDSARNCVTLCNTCHQGYHRGKNSITFATENLPHSIAGHTFNVSKDEGINWKTVKSKMKNLRKTLMSERIYLTIADIEILMKFLEINFDAADDD